MVKTFWIDREKLQCHSILLSCLYMTHTLLKIQSTKEHIFFYIIVSKHWVDLLRWLAHDFVKEWHTFFVYLLADYRMGVCNVFSTQQQSYAFYENSQPFGQLGLRPEVQPTLRVPLRGLASPNAWQGWWRHNMARNSNDCLQTPQARPCCPRQRCQRGRRRTAPVRWWS